ncbi:cell wall metabolism sensor histidine kinase WalK [Notoacmeibacter sp. MSK16QG-6]|uniref:sensor histidine kinase n=1 Tax=Notoacmeibacter sp. MSK16QG-6 TaxID=2957982 RepID=UPI00209FBCBD|nr:ATP-binding protein [Notoacmeibacter sp. MSK16QG-6]MCP1198112.1 HAMP domain-containing histidine kinase [Notoacmeibacter sp. MSK16QG-6]
MAVRLPAMLRSTATRLSALFVLLFMACAMVLVFYMTALSARMMASQTRATIDEEVAELADVYRRGGLPRLIRTLDRRSRQPGAYLYLVAGQDGRILTGNVEALDPDLLDREGWTRKPFAYLRYGDSQAIRSGELNLRALLEGDDAHHAMAQVFMLPNGMAMLVGRDLGEPERLRDITRQAIVMALAIMGLGSLLIWYFVGRRGLRRVEKVSVATDRIMAGDLSQRLPVTSAGDEFDQLSSGINIMLGRIGELNEGLKHVADNIAHDLKTPLTRIRNRAEAALANHDDPEATRLALEQTIAESDQLIRTFAAILRISRLEAGNSIDDRTAVNLTEIAADVCELYEPAADEAGGTLSCDVGQEPLMVRANRELIGQAIANLVENALRHGVPEEGPIAIDIRLEKEEGKAVLTVADNGPGVPAAERNRVTERFVRLEESRTRPGSGLGLSLVKAVAQFHEGRLVLEDNAPGLAARLCLPIQAEMKKPVNKSG